MPRNLQKYVANYTPNAVTTLRTSLILDLSLTFLNENSQKKTIIAFKFHEMFPMKSLLGSNCNQSTADASHTEKMLTIVVWASGSPTCYYTKWFIVQFYVENKNEEEKRERK